MPLYQALSPPSGTIAISTDSASLAASGLSSPESLRPSCGLRMVCYIHYEDQGQSSLPFSAARGPKNNRGPRYRSTGGNLNFGEANCLTLSR